MSSRLRPSSTRGSPEELSTMIKVAASRGRSARGLARVLGACGCSTVMLPPLDQALARILCDACQQRRPLALTSVSPPFAAGRLWLPLLHGGNAAGAGVAHRP